MDSLGSTPATGLLKTGAKFGAGFYSSLQVTIRKKSWTLLAQSIFSGEFFYIIFLKLDLIFFNVKSKIFFGK